MTEQFDPQVYGTTPFSSDPWSVWNTRADVNAASRHFDYSYTTHDGAFVDQQKTYSPAANAISPNAISAHRRPESIYHGAVAAANTSNYSSPHASSHRSHRRHKPKEVPDSLTDGYQLPVRKENNTTRESQHTRPSSSSFLYDDRASTSASFQQHCASAHDNRRRQLPSHVGASEIDYSYSEIGAWSFEEPEPAELGIDGEDLVIVVNDDPEDEERKVERSRRSKRATKHGNKGDRRLGY